MTQLVTSITSFNSKSNLAACIKNGSSYSGWLTTNYPGVPQVLVGADPTSSLDGVLAGNCSGAVLPDVQLSYVTGPADPNGTYCGLEQVGGVLNSNNYALAWSLATPPSVIYALDVLLVNALAGGTYDAIAAQSFWPSRPQCSALAAAAAEALAAANSPPALGLKDFAGVFFCQVRPPGRARARGAVRANVCARACR